MTTLANSLCTLDEVKEYMGKIGSNSTTDDLLEDLIVRITEAFESYCGISQFKSQDYTEYYSGQGTSELFLDQRHINSISLIADDTDWVFGSDTTVGSDSYAILDDHVVLKDTYFTTGIRNLKIEYNAGYSTIPNDLKQTSIEEVACLYNKRKGVDITSRTASDGSVTKIQQGFLPGTINILKRYIGTGVY